MADTLAARARDELSVCLMTEVSVLRTFPGAGERDRRARLLLRDGHHISWQAALHELVELLSPLPAHALSWLGRLLLGRALRLLGEPPVRYMRELEAVGWYD